MKHLTRILLIAAIKILLVSSKLNENCLAPSGVSGTCTYIPSCPQIFRKLFQRDVTRQQVEDLSKRNQCGHQNRQPLVCCTKLPTAATATTVPAESVEGFSDQMQPNRAVNHRWQPSHQWPDRDECGTVQYQSRVVGGGNADIGELPWMALIKYVQPTTGRIGLHCAATLINRNFVITAAHCIFGKSIFMHWTPTDIRLGEWNLATNVDCIGDDDNDDDLDCADPHVDIPIRQVRPHPYYLMNAKDQYHDIALVQMVRSVEFTDFIKPICLPPPSPPAIPLEPLDYAVGHKSFSRLSAAATNRSSSPSNTYLVAGWGATEKSAKSNILQKTSVKEVDLNTCVAKYKMEKLFIMSNQLCAQADARDTCQGDSGAPLMGINKGDNGLSKPYWYIAGIVSFGVSPCANNEWPGVYTRLIDYVNWIENAVSTAPTATSPPQQSSKA